MPRSLVQLPVGAMVEQKEQVTGPQMGLSCSVNQCFGGIFIGKNFDISTSIFLTMSRVLILTSWVLGFFLHLNCDRIKTGFTQVPERTS